jgi:alpha-L-rhamnosidase
MVDRGPTTVWEEWGGVDADGNPHASLNHYSKGAVISFLHQYVAGLQVVAPGYRRFRVAPRPGGGLSSAREPATIARPVGSRSRGSSRASAAASVS